MSTQPTDFDKLWDYGDPAATETRLLELLAAFEATQDRAYEGQLLTQIARAQGLQGKFEQAHATLDDVERIITSGDDDSLVRVRYLLERGRVLNSSGNREEARPRFEQAWKLARSYGFDFYAIDAAHMIAIVEPLPDEQLRWNTLALEVAEASGDQRARNWRGSLYNNIGWTWFEQKQYERAMEVFEKALEIRLAEAKPREVRIARYCVAKTLRMQGKIEQAITIDRELVEQAERAGEPDGYFLEELAECLLASDRIAESKPVFRGAHEQLSRDKWLADTERARLQRLKNLGQ